MASLDVRLRHRGHKAPAVVLDLGAAYTRVGFAGEEQPRHAIPTPEQLDHSAAPPTTAARWRTLLSPFLRHLYFHLLLLSPRDRRLCVVEPVYLPTHYKRALLAVALQLDVPAVLFFPALSLPLLLSPSPLNAGLVVDIGRRESRVVASWLGALLMETGRTVPGGMVAVGQELLRLVAADERNAAVRRRLETEVDERQLEEMVARVVYAAAADKGDAGADVMYDIKPVPSSYLHFSSSSFVPVQTSLSLPPLLPTASLTAFTSPGSSFPSLPLLSVAIPASARAAAASVLFGSGVDDVSLSSAILSHLRTLPLDARHAVLANIVVAGGGSELPGVHAAIQQHLVAALSALTHTAVGGRVADGLSSRLAGSVRVRESVAGVSGSTLGWVGASVMGAVLVESEEEWMGSGEMRLYVLGGSSKPSSDEDEAKQLPSDAAAQQQASLKRGQDSSVAELEDWLFPLVGRARVSAKDASLSSSVYLSGARSRPTTGVQLPVTTAAEVADSATVADTNTAAEAAAAEDDSEQF